MGTKCIDLNLSPDDMLQNSESNMHPGQFEFIQVTQENFKENDIDLNSLPFFEGGATHEKDTGL
ncbi:hypothetical protein DCAR_0726782 [Daucus carota subsp. sativus]|uniref:Uncharacterized protein n=1 Tax=Daucus carota subsp. sativus TaxID=79200 RepID=A0A164SJW2_DAUCS|nr:hypothetical protein DCAR_0726782 [Daucus carota subsp. sativus]